MRWTSKADLRTQRLLEKRKQRKDWHAWFAWYPVREDEQARWPRRVFWLETVERAKLGNPWWVYRGMK